MRKLDRHRRLLAELRHRDHHTIDALALRVGASRRTVIRDIAELRDQGYVIESEPGRGGGVALDPRSIISRPRLMASEVAALIIYTAVAEKLSLLPFPSRTRAALDKIEASLHAESLRDLRRLFARIHVGPASTARGRSEVNHSNFELVFEGIERAFFSQHCIDLSYRDSAGRDTHRKVEPQGILIMAPVWYLIGFDTEKQELRHFRIDRILKLEIDFDKNFMLRKLHLEGAKCPFGGG
ncbi:helix-turn-helix transcriptional regulator [Gimibacter soli]|uniref:WYL domain-containing protein n=1 Tax=Gimibacter soli TaxID=3024400 RepID=A0AAE9XSV7_9PROT|nr:WYL domain-containing protein [Gimibacter soli]WCL53465.1 WYL domain-containing protein [Gimibacter soli]